MRHDVAGRGGSGRKAVTETSRRSRQIGSRRMRSSVKGVLRLRGSNGEHDVSGGRLEGGRRAHVNMGCPGSALKREPYSGGSGRMGGPRTGGRVALMIRSAPKRLSKRR